MADEQGPPPTASTTSIELFSPGSVLSGRYRIERELGRGGFGVVYRACDEQLHKRTVVIKVRHEATTSEEWKEKKFRQESEALARIDHPGVVGVLDQGRTPEGKFFLVMQYVDGITLRQALHAGPMDLSRVAGLVSHISQALTAAHESGVCHRDLKPENIMLRKLPGGRELPVIIDFGIAGIRALDTSGSDSTKVAGSMNYMAPEQFDGRPEPASDIYSLGVIAVEMITGERPARSHFDLLFQQIDGVPERLLDLRKDFPVTAKSVILRAVAYEPKQRYPRALEFGDELFNALTSKVGTVPGKFWFRRSGLLAALLLVLLSTISILVPKLGHFKSIVNPNTPVQSRTLTYWLLVQKYRNEKPFRQPFVLGRRLFVESGDRLQFVLISPQPGHLYLLNQGPLLENGLPSFNSIFPSSTGNHGSSFLPPSQEFHFPTTISLKFDEQQGTEKLWIIWSGEELSEFAALRKWTEPGHDGSIKDPRELMLVRDFVGSSSTATAEVDDATKRTRLTHKGDPLVYSISLDHQ